MFFKEQYWMQMEETNLIIKSWLLDLLGENNAKTKISLLCSEETYLNVS